MPKCAIYARVSTREQTTENQVRLLKEEAERRGWAYEILEEKKTTRKTRPVKEALLRQLYRGKYKTVLVYKLDRWARSTGELVTEITDLFSRGVAFVSLRDNIDLSTASGKLYFHIISAFAEFERDLIRERTLAGLERAKAEGKTLGRPGLDPEVATEARRLRKSGLSYRAIAGQLGIGLGTVQRVCKGVPKSPSENPPGSTNENVQK